MKSIFEQRLMNIIPQLSETQIKYLHDKFIDIQFSQEPTINGEDIRGINLFPFNPTITNTTKQELKEAKSLDNLSNYVFLFSLLKDIENEIWEFQSESELEDNLIIKGLEYIIHKVKTNKLQPKN